MKLKYCIILSAVLTALLLLPAVAAGENATVDADDLNSDILAGGLSSGEAESKNITITNSIVTNESHQTYYISVELNCGTACNTKLHQNFSGNVEYVGHNISVGTYDFDSGIWDIGNLTSSKPAYLIVATKVKPYETYSYNSKLTTDTPDVTVEQKFQITVPPWAVYFTSDSNDVNGPNHDEHHQSNPGHSEVWIVGPLDENKTSPSPGDRKSDANSTAGKDGGSKNGENSKSEGNSKAEGSSKSNAGSASKSILNRNNDGLAGGVFKSLSDAISRVKNPLADSIQDILSPVSSIFNGKHVMGIIAYNYTTVPMMIFSIFLMMLIAIAGYDKIKSRY